MITSRSNRAVLIFLSTLIFTCCFAQSNSSNQMPRLGNIRGQAKLQDGRPAPMGFAVYLEQRSGGNAGQTQTDRQGKFSFDQIPADVYRVVIRAPGYASAEQEVNLLTISHDYVEFTLRPTSSSTNAQPSTGMISALDAKAPDDARKNVEDGEKLLASGKDIDKSITLFRKATETYPQYVRAYLLLGTAYSSQQKWEEAEKPLRKAIELDRLSSPSYIALGAVENEKQNYGQAEQALKRAVELSPDSPDAHFELGRAYWGLSNWDAADTELLKAIQLRPASAGEHLLRGNVLLRKRDATGALKEFQDVLRLDPKGPMAAPTTEMINRIENVLKEVKK
jgi:tetratricopeptide (TPR) repeat protein